jgi:hypothetical protein
MVAAWIDGPEADRITETKNDLIFPGVRARHATVIDLMNGTEQDLDYSVDGGSTIIRNLR